MTLVRYKLKKEHGVTATGVYVNIYLEVQLTSLIWFLPGSELEIYFDVYISQMDQEKGKLSEMVQ